MSWRDTQLNAFTEPVTIRQDHDLIEFIKLSNETECVGMGDTEYFEQYIKFTNGPANLAICIINKPFDFVRLAQDLNGLIANKLNSHAIIYLAINKFLANPIIHNCAVEDYDMSVVNFIAEAVNATIVEYAIEPDDSGHHFNFVHPVTRFFLRRKN